MKEQIYQVVSDPYTDDYNVWHMDIMYFIEHPDGSKEPQERGVITIPTAEVGYAIQKYFRKNVNPIDNKQLNKIIDQAILGATQ